MNANSPDPLHGVGGVYETGPDGKLRQLQAPTTPPDHPDHPKHPDNPKNKKSTEAPGNSDADQE